MKIINNPQPSAFGIFAVGLRSKLTLQSPGLMIGVFRVAIKKYWPFGLFVLLVAIFFWPSIFQNKIPMPGDHLLGTYYPWLDIRWPGFPAGVPVKNPLLADVPSLFYPQKIFSMSEFAEGRFPAWNPLIFNGYPLLANFQSGVLNPFNIVFLLFDSGTAWTFFIAIQPFLALLLTYFFLRDFRLSRSASVFGAITYAFCGFNLLWLEYGIHGYVSAFVPVLFFLTRRLIFCKNWHTSSLYFSVLLAGQIFAGYPQLTVYTVVFLAIWGTFLKRKLSTLVRLLISVAVATGLAAILLIPGFELFANSQRPGEPLSGGQAGAHLKLEHLITLLSPDYFGNPSTYNTWGSFSYTNNTGYASLVALVVALVGWKSRDRMRLFFLFLYLLPLIFSLPTFITSFIQKLPLFSASVATRSLVFSAFSVSVLAGLGLDRISTHKKFSITPLFVFGVIISAAYFFTANPVAHRNLILPTGLLFITTVLLAMPKTVGFNPRMKVSFLTKSTTKDRGLSGTGNLLVAIRRLLVSNKLATSVLIILLTFELFRFGWKYNVFFSKGLIFPPTPLTDYLKSQSQGFRIDGGDTLPLSVWMGYGVSSSSGYDALYPQRWATYLAAIDSRDTSTMKGRLGDFRNFSSPLAAVSGVKYVVSLKRDLSGHPNPTGVPYPRFTSSALAVDREFGSVQVLRNDAALPLFSLKNSAVTATDSEAIALLQQPGFDYRQKIILSSPANIFRPEPTLLPGIKLVSSSSINHELISDTSSPAYLLHTQNFYPGWTAFIDGIKVPVLRANYAFQAIELPSGHHNIRFTYLPDSLRIGAYVSLAFLISALTYVCSRIAQRRSSGLV